MEEQQSYSLQGIRNLGEALIIHALSCARYALTSTPAYKFTKKHHEGEQGVLFLKGSSLEHVIIFFNLPVDADKLRNLFYYKVTYYKKKGDSNHG